MSLMVGVTSQGNKGIDNWQLMLMYLLNICGRYLAIPPKRSKLPELSRAHTLRVYLHPSSTSAHTELRILSPGELQLAESVHIIDNLYLHYCARLYAYYACQLHTKT
jgi:hypothetical protein